LPTWTRAFKIALWPAVSVAAQIGRILAGKYRLDRALGTGGMGTVVAATHLGLGRKVALKFMRLGVLDDGEAIGRFMREARAAATLRSEHVAQVMDVEVDTEDGAPYIVMEYLEGSDLASLLEAKGVPPATDAVDYVLQACEGLAEAHANGIVHRDLKPANLFLTCRPDGAPLVKVLDFGVSKLNEAAQSGSFHLTQPKKAIGSPHYMSPEQMVASPDVDQRADIWALGVILYELLSGKPPFAGTNFLELGLEVTNRAHAPLARRVPGISPGLAAVVDRCLQKTAPARFANLAELASALVPHAGPGAKAAADRIARTLGVGAQSTGTPTAITPRRDRRVVIAAVGAGLAAAAAGVLWRRVKSVHAVATVAPPPPAPQPATPPPPFPVAAPPPAPEPIAEALQAAPRKHVAPPHKRRRAPEVRRAAAPVETSAPATEHAPVEERATRTKRGPVVTDI
jgi:eukaryotic-like serine/threonine-protein kinase